MTDELGPGRWPKRIESERPDAIYGQRPNGNRSTGIDFRVVGTKRQRAAAHLDAAPAVPTSKKIKKITATNQKRRFGSRPRPTGETLFVDDLSDEPISADDRTGVTQKSVRACAAKERERERERERRRRWNINKDAATLAATGL